MLPRVGLEYWVTADPLKPYLLQIEQFQLSDSGLFCSALLNYDGLPDPNENKLRYNCVKGFDTYINHILII